MGAYYYLVAQLPSLSFGQDMPMPSARAFELCASFMSKEDAAILAFCVLDPFTMDSAKRGAIASPLVSGWLAWERSLRFALSRLRARKLEREAPFAEDVDAEAAAVAKAAAAVESPLEAELFLARARWDYLDSLLGYEYFGRDVVYGYLLKLLLLERKASFRVEEGFAAYTAIYASVMEAAPISTISGEPK